MEVMKHLSLIEIQSTGIASMLQTRILGRADREGELFDEMHWSKKHESQKARKWSIKKESEILLHLLQ